MYRKPNGSLGFNSAALGDLPGALSSSSGADPGHISLAQQDSIYLFQLQFSNPCALTAETLHVSQIIDHASVARKVFAQLQKLGLLSTTSNSAITFTGSTVSAGASAGAGASASAGAGEVDTAAFGSPSFGKQFTHALAMIPVSRQKQLVDFLFWWDDETRRLRKLLEEREELTVMRDTAQDAPQRERLQLLLERVQLKIGARPSQRNPAMERDEDLMGTSAAATATGSAGAGEVEETLPAYKP